ncbi:MAG: hypothetical protein QM723_17315 [Myxococcaceae bacterium]
MLVLVAALVLNGSYAFTAKTGELSLTVPKTPAFCVVLPEATLNPDGCVNESVETLEHKRTALSQNKTNALIADADKGTLLIIVRDYEVKARKGTPSEEAKAWFGRYLKKETDEGRELTFEAGAKIFDVQSFNGVQTAHAAAAHELPDGKWHEIHWLVLTPKHDYDVMVQSSGTHDLAELGKTVMSTLQVPAAARLQLEGKK